MSEKKKRNIFSQIAQLPPAVIRLAGRILRTLFGSLSYTPPAYMIRFWQKGAKEGETSRERVKRYMKKLFLAFLILVGIFILGIGGLFGWYLWDSSRPQDLEIDYSVSEILSVADPEEPVQPLKVRFRGSAAPKERTGEVLSEGITIKPEFPGEWKWEESDLLVFQPERPWDIGGEYSIKMDKSLFPKHIKVQEQTFTVTVPGLLLRAQTPEFYIDPTDSSIKRVMNTYRFNYPVDPVSFEGQIRIYPDLEKDSGTLENRDYSFELTFNETFTEAYLISEPLGLPLKDVDVHILLGDGVATREGSVPLEEEKDQTVIVPGISSFVSINSLSLELVKNDSQLYDQVLVAATRGSISGETLKENMDVWLLPKDIPDLPGIRGYEDYNWGDPDFVTREVLDLSRKLPFSALPTEQENSNLNSFSVTAEPSRHIYIRIRQGTPFYGGYYLAEDYERIIQIPEYPSELRIVSDGNVLSLSGDKRLAAYSRGIRKVGYRIHRIMPKDINHLVTQSNGNIENFQFRNYNFSIDNISKTYESTLELGMDSPRELQYFSIDMAEYLKTIPRENLRYGLFLIELGELNRSYLNVRDRRLIMVSDLGMLVKTNQDGSRDLFVQSIATGSPLENVEVQVLGKNGIPLASRMSDSGGHVMFPDLQFSRAENTPAAFIAVKGEDLSFLPYSAPGRYLDYSSFDTGGLYGSGDPKTLMTQVFSDRGLYRPGDTVNGAFIIKAGDWEVPLQGTPLLLRVIDPRGQNIHEENISLSADGFNDFSFPTQSYSPTGEYEINLYLVNEKSSNVYLGGTFIKVEEFLPDRLKVNTLFNRSSEGWISPDDLQALVSVRNLYGAPSGGSSLSATLALTPASLYFHKYRDYRFLQPRGDRLSYSEDLGDGTTGEDGSYTYKLPMEKFTPDTYRLRVSVEAFEKAGGRSVSSGAEVLISPLKALVGYKADGDLNYIHKGSLRNVELIAIAPDLQQISLEGTRLSLKRFEYVSTLVKQPSGVYKYQSIEQTKEVKEEPLAIAPDGTTVSLDSSEPGKYQLEVLDEEDNVLTRLVYTIVGETNLTRSLNRSAELEIKLDRQDYKGGETIEVSIAAPYAGAGLITIERDKVYAYKWFKTDSTSTVQRIRLPEGELEGNGYVTVSYIRSPGSREIFMSPLSYGSVPFSLDKESRTQKISLNYPEVVKPGEELTIEYSSNRRGKIIIYAVDQGILQVAGYTMPDPLAYFFRKRALEVKTAQILDLILPEYRIVRQFSEMGGGMEADLLANNLNPFRRKDRAPVVFWSGILDADREVRSVNYTVPDYFNGSLKIMAVCVSREAIGSTQSEAFARDTFIIQPSAPLAVTPGDEFLFQATVANNFTGSGENARISLTLSTGEELTPEETEKVLTIPEGKDSTVSFPVKVGEFPGPAELVLEASSGGETSRMSHSLSIRPAVPFRTEILTGVNKRGSDTVPVEREMYADFRTLRAGVSSLPMGLAGGLGFYLEEYPYTCTEQLVSMAFPKLFEGYVTNLELDREKAEADYGRTIGILMARQNQEGGFGMWTVKSDSVPLIDLYAFQYLQEARQKGRFVPSQLYDMAEDRAEDLASYGGTSREDFRIRSYASFLLTASGKITTRFLEELRTDLKETSFDWKSDLTGLYLASSYSILQMDAQAGSILREVRGDIRKEELPEGYHDRLSYLSQYLLILSRYAPDRMKQVSPEVLDGIAAELGENNFTTFSASMALVAIQSYSDRAGRMDAGLGKVTALLNDKTERVLSLSGDILKTADFSEETEELKIENSGSQPLYYQVILGGFDRNPPEQEVSSGIEILREYTDREGNPVNRMQLGETYQARLRVRSLSKGTVPNLAVVDLFPACLEPDTQSIREGNSSPSGEKFLPDYTDIREDRLILYGSVDENLKEYVYPVRAVYAGEFTVPPLFAEAMYDRDTYALQTSSVLTVEE